MDLFVASFLALFLEVMFIRWVPSYERILAYFTNFVLIAAFLGLGLGAMLTVSGEAAMVFSLTNACHEFHEWAQRSFRKIRG